MTEGRSDEEPISFGPIAEAIAQAGRRRTVPPATLLCEEGRATSCMFLVLSGELEVEKAMSDGACAVSRLGPGALVGLLPALDGQPCVLSTRTLTEATVAELDSAALLAMIEPGEHQNLAVAHELARLAIRRLRGATDELARALYEALVSEQAPGRVDPMQMARIQAANHAWALS